MSGLFQQDCPFPCLNSARKVSPFASDASIWLFYLEVLSRREQLLPSRFGYGSSWQPIPGVTSNPQRLKRHGRVRSKLANFCSTKSEIPNRSNLLNFQEPERTRKWLLLRMERVLSRSTRGSSRSRIRSVTATRPTRNGSTLSISTKADSKSFLADTKRWDSSLRQTETSRIVNGLPMPLQLI